LRRVFSIICTVRNRADQIRGCVESVLAQDDPDVEMVVHDGASTDGTLQILREYGDRISLISEPDPGAGHGLFRALRRARGAFWGSCLSDERLLPDAVSWARRTFETHPQLGAIYGFADGVDRHGARVARQDAGEFSLERLLTYRQLPPFVAAFFRMDAYRQLDLWEYTGGGEIDLWMRFAVRFPICYFPKLVARYGMDPATLSNQPAVYEAERAGRLETLRRLFHDDPAGTRYQHLEARAIAGYLFRVAGMFVRLGDVDRARELVDEAAAYGTIDELFADDPRERQRMAWLQYTVRQPSNIWAALPARGIHRVAIFGGEGWGLAIQRQLAAANVTCLAVIDNNAGARQAAMIPAPYYSQDDFLQRRPAVDAVISSLQGDHDSDVLAALQAALGPAVPVMSWKTMMGDC
jgi:glycosyltransferase involved in cell wall biosynthesis